MAISFRNGILRELVTFGLVGGVGLVVDVTTFNLLRITVLDPAHVHNGPVIAKAISTTLAIAVNWVGNRLVTFRSKRRSDVVREGVEFAIVSGIGMAIALGCLWVSHYLLGFTSLLADNVATNVIGLALGTAFRFVLYRWWVYGDRVAGGAKVAILPSNISSNTMVGWNSTLESTAADGLDQSANPVVGV